MTGYHLDVAWVDWNGTHRPESKIGIGGFRYVSPTLPKLLLLLAGEWRVFIAQEVHVCIHPGRPAVIAYREVKHASGVFAGEQDDKKCDELHDCYPDAIDPQGDPMGKTYIDPTEEHFGQKMQAGQLLRVLNGEFHSLLTTLNTLLFYYMRFEYYAMY